MTRDGEALSTERLRELLDELSTELASQGERAQLFVVGGAAMALAYDESRTTRDVDAVFEPKGQVRELAARQRRAEGVGRSVNGGGPRPTRQAPPALPTRGPSGPTI